jgi:serine/threonine protein kinase
LEHHIKDREDPNYGKRMTDYLEIFAGAPAYKAPELLQDKPFYSEKSDVFAFSIVCWEMITTLISGVYV